MVCYVARNVLKEFKQNELRVKEEQLDNEPKAFKPGQELQLHCYIGMDVCLSENWVWSCPPFRMIWHYWKLFWHCSTAIATITTCLDILSCLYPTALNMQSNRSLSRWNGIQLTLISTTCEMWRFLVVNVCVWWRGCINPRDLVCDETFRRCCQRSVFNTRL